MASFLRTNSNRCPKCGDWWYVVEVGCPKKAAKTMSTKCCYTKWAIENYFASCRLTRRHRHFYCCNYSCGKKDEKGHVTLHHYFTKAL